jgi:AcrR family transcriptional regulator
VYSREDVSQAAFDLVEARGLSALSARAVAHHLSSSTAPVYSNFDTMAELALAVIRQAKDLLQQYAAVSYTDRVFLNMGVGFVRFARDHRNLFRALFLEGDKYRNIIGELHGEMLTLMGRDPKLAPLSLDQKGVLLSKMAMFTFGYATQVCVGLMRATTDEDIITTLQDVGSRVVDAAIEEAQGRK